jgi:hypothetical protein
MYSHTIEYSSLRPSLCSFTYAEKSASEPKDHACARGQGLEGGVKALTLSSILWAMAGNVAKVQRQMRISTVGCSGRMRFSPGHTTRRTRHRCGEHTLQVAAETAASKGNRSEQIYRNIKMGNLKGVATKESIRQDRSLQMV